MRMKFRNWSNDTIGDSIQGEIMYKSRLRYKLLLTNNYVKNIVLILFYIKMVLTLRTCLVYIYVH